MYAICCQQRSYDLAPFAHTHFPHLALSLTAGGIDEANGSVPELYQNAFLAPLFKKTL